MLDNETRLDVLEARMVNLERLLVELLDRLRAVGDLAGVHQAVESFWNELLGLDEAGRYPADFS